MSQCLFVCFVHSMEVTNSYQHSKILKLSSVVISRRKIIEFWDETRVSKLLFIFFTPYLGELFHQMCYYTGYKLDDSLTNFNLLSKILFKMLICHNSTCPIKENWALKAIHVEPLSIALWMVFWHILNAKIYKNSLCNLKHVCVHVLACTMFQP